MMQNLTRNPAGEPEIIITIHMNRIARDSDSGGCCLHSKLSSWKANLKGPSIRVIELEFIWHHQPGMMTAAPAARLIIMWDGKDAWSVWKNLWYSHGVYTASISKFKFVIFDSDISVLVLRYPVRLGYSKAQFKCSQASECISKCLVNFDTKVLQY